MSTRYGMINLIGSMLFHENGVPIGEVSLDVDGRYKFYPILGRRLLDEGILQDMSSCLKSLNQSFHQAIDQYEPLDDTMPLPFNELMDPFDQHVARS